MRGILDFFVPREKKFFDMLRALSGKTSEGARLFIAFIVGYGELSSARRKASVEALKQIEAECDELTHGIAIELNRTFLTPIDREDIHRLSTLIDDIMDILYNISHKLVLYDLKKLPRYVPELARVSLECTEEVNFLVLKLDERKMADQHLKRIHELEKQADSIRNEAFAYLFKDSLAAVDIIKFKDIYEWLETACDKAEDVADVIEGIVIKYA